MQNIDKVKQYVLDNGMADLIDLMSGMIKNK